MKAQQLARRRPFQPALPSSHTTHHPIGHHAAGSIPERHHSTACMAQQEPSTAHGPSSAPVRALQAFAALRLRLAQLSFFAITYSSSLSTPQQQRLGTAGWPMLSTPGHEARQGNVAPLQLPSLRPKPSRPSSAEQPVVVAGDSGGSGGSGVAGGDGGHGSSGGGGAGPPLWLQVLLAAALAAVWVAVSELLGGGGSKNSQPALWASSVATRLRAGTQHAPRRSVGDDQPLLWIQRSSRHTMVRTVPLSPCDI